MHSHRLLPPHLRLLAIWNVLSGDLEKRLSSHQCGAVGLAWGMGGSNGQQVASIDKSGALILWA